jgi:hypothetical protein
MNISGESIRAVSTVVVTLVSASPASVTGTCHFQTDVQNKRDFEQYL